jgi:hypothetical protein
MPAHVCPVLIEMGTERYAAGINAPSKAEPAEVVLLSVPSAAKPPRRR